MRLFVLLFVVLFGCGPAESVGKQRLLEMAQSAKGHLTPLLASPAWSGDRLRMAGLENGKPVMASIGPWDIRLAPDSDRNVVEIKGLHFAKKSIVTLDVDKDILEIDGHQFAGRVIESTSPMFDDLPFKGVSFERPDGAVCGRASIIFLEDGRVALDFHKVYVHGNRAGEYGAVVAQ